MKAIRYHRLRKRILKDPNQQSAEQDRLNTLYVKAWVKKVCLMFLIGIIMVNVIVIGKIFG